MGVVVEKRACLDEKNCGSSDAMAVYEDGSGYCFSCDTFFKDAGNGEGAVSRTASDPNLIPGGDFKALTKRGITQDTVTKYGYRTVKHQGKPLQLAAYYKDGKLVAQHTRDAQKNFRWLGDSKGVELFGQNCWKTGGKRLVICEGEIDAMSCAQALSPQLKWPVVSIPSGVGSAVKSVKDNLEYLESFDELVIAFDQDEPGAKAAQQVAEILTPGKVKLVRWPEGVKDANELLQQGKPGAIVTAIFEAVTYRPDGILAGTDITLDDLMTEEEVFSYDLPFPKVDQMLRGIRKQEVFLVAAGSGVGKTSLVREIGYHLLTKKGLKVGGVFLEESVKKSALGYVAIDQNVPLGDLYLNRKLLTEAQWKKAYQRTINSGRAFFFDHFGSLDSDNLMAKLKYMAVSLEVDFIILDHITIAISGLLGNSAGGPSMDERKEIDSLMTQLRSLAEQTGVGIIVISHVRRPQGSGDKGFEDGLKLSLSALRGSGSLAQLSDTVLAVERDQQAEDPNVSLLRVLKNRLFGFTGEGDSVRYHPKSGRMLTDEPPDDFAEEPPPEEQPPWEGQSQFEDF